MSSWISDLWIAEGAPPPIKGVTIDENLGLPTSPSIYPGEVGGAVSLVPKYSSLEAAERGFRAAKNAKTPVLSKLPTPSLRAGSKLTAQSPKLVSTAPTSGYTTPACNVTPRDAPNLPPAAAPMPRFKSLREAKEYHLAMAKASINVPVKQASPQYGNINKGPVRRLATPAPISSPGLGPLPRFKSLKEAKEGLLAAAKASISATPVGKINCTNTPGLLPVPKASPLPKFQSDEEVKNGMSSTMSTTTPPPPRDSSSPMEVQISPRLSAPSQDDIPEGTNTGLIPIPGAAPLNKFQPPLEHVEPMAGFTAPEELSNSPYGAYGYSGHEPILPENINSPAPMPSHGVVPVNRFQSPLEPSTGFNLTTQASISSMPSQVNTFSEYGSPPHTFVNNFIAPGFVPAPGPFHTGSLHNNNATPVPTYQSPQTESKTSVSSLSSYRPQYFPSSNGQHLPPSPRMFHHLLPPARPNQHMLPPPASSQGIPFPLSANHDMLFPPAFNQNMVPSWNMGQNMLPPLPSGQNMFYPPTAGPSMLSLLADTLPPTPAFPLAPSMQSGQDTLNPPVATKKNRKHPPNTKKSPQNTKKSQKDSKKSPQKGGQEMGPPSSDHQEMVPPSTVNQEVGPPSAVSQDMGPPSSVSQGMGPPSAVSQDMGPPSAVSQEMAPPSAVSQEIGPPSAVSQEIGPCLTVSQEMGPPSTVSQQMAPPLTLSQEMVLPSTVSQSIGLPSTVSQEMVPTSTVSQEMVPTSTVSQEMVPPVGATQDKLPSQAVTQETVLNTTVSREMIPSSGGNQEVLIPPAISQDLPASETMCQQIPHSSGASQDKSPSQALIQQMDLQQNVSEETVSHPAADKDMTSQTVGQVAFQTASYGQQMPLIPGASQEKPCPPVDSQGVISTPAVHPDQDMISSPVGQDGHSIQETSQDKLSSMNVDRHDRDMPCTPKQRQTMIFHPPNSGAGQNLVSPQCTGQHVIPPQRAAHHMLAPARAIQLTLPPPRLSLPQPRVSSHSKPTHQ